MTAEGVNINIDLTQAKDTQNKWEDTGSGQIFGRLNEIGKRLGKPVTIEGKNTGFEIFRLGDEQAFVYSFLKGGTAGEDNGVVSPAVESHHYKRLPWWREAIEPISESLQFLDPPVMWVAKDAGVENYEALFRPSQVRQYLGVTEDQDSSKISHQIEEIISSEIDPLVIPHYNVKKAFGALRLNALTPEAIASRTIDNDAYKRSLEVVKQVATGLPAKYSLIK